MSATTTTTTTTTTTINAVRFHGNQDVRLDKVPVPAESDLKPGFVRLAPKFCGICGTDLHEYYGGPTMIPSPGHPHPITGETLPVIIGHEFSAVVVAVGESVTNVRPGDHVCVQPLLFDGDCLLCESGMINCCERSGFLGLTGWGGGMAELTDVPVTAVKLLPASIPLEVGALVEPLAVGWHAVSISPYKEGDAALVLGGGPIGLATIQALVSKGCQKIIVSEVVKRRRDFASQFGAHHVFDPTAVDLVAEVERLTGGYGVKVAFDCAGVQVAVDTAFQALGKNGTLVNVALWEKPVTLNMNNLFIRERSYMASATYGQGDFEAVIEAIVTGQLKPEGMITKKVAMDKVVDEGIKALVDDRDNQVKILIDMTKPVA